MVRLFIPSELYGLSATRHRIVHVPCAWDPVPKFLAAPHLASEVASGLFGSFDKDSLLDIQLRRTTISEGTPEAEARQLANFESSEYITSS